MFFKIPKQGTKDYKTISNTFLNKKNKTCILLVKGVELLGLASLHIKSY